MLTIAPAPAGAVTLIVTGFAAAIPSEGSVQVTGPVPEQLQPVPVAEPNVTPAGRESVSETELACDGPALATFRV